MGDREPVALRREGQPARRRVEAYLPFAALWVACDHALAARPGERTIGAGGEGIDPAPLCVVQHGRRPVAGGGDHTAVVSPRHQTIAVQRGAQDNAFGMGGDRPFRIGRTDCQSAVIAREHRH